MSLRADRVLESVQYEPLGISNIQFNIVLDLRGGGDSFACHRETEMKSLTDGSHSFQLAMYPSEVCKVI